MSRTRGCAPMRRWSGSRSPDPSIGGILLIARSIAELLARQSRDALALFPRRFGVVPATLLRHPATLLRHSRDAPSSFPRKRESICFAIALRAAIEASALRAGYFLSACPERK